MTVSIPMGQIAIRALSAQPIDMLRNCFVIWSPNRVSRGPRSVKILFEKSLPRKTLCEVSWEKFETASIAGPISGIRFIVALEMCALDIWLQLEFSIAYTGYPTIICEIVGLLLASSAICLDVTDHGTSTSLRYFSFSLIRSCCLVIPLSLIQVCWRNLWCGDICTSEAWLPSRHVFYLHTMAHIRRMYHECMLVEISRGFHWSLS